MNYKKDGPLLFLSGESYERYMGYLNKKQMENEKIEQEKAHKRYLKEKSDEMANSWHDSIRSIKNRENEKIEMKEKLLEERRVEQVEHYQHVHEEQRQKFLAEAREKMKTRRFPNLALSNALLQSHVRAENEAYLKLKKEIQREEAENENKWVELIQESVQTYEHQEEEEKCKARQKSKLVQAFQLKQIEEQLRRDVNEKNNRIKEEQEILKKMNEEIEEREQNEIEDARERKSNMTQYMRSHFQRKQKVEQISKTEEAERQAVCDIYNDFYTNRDCQIAKQRKQEAKRELGLSSNSKQEYETGKQDQLYLNQCMEYEERYQQQKDQDTKRKEKMVKELNIYYKDSRMRKKEEDHVNAELLRFGVAERLKKCEILKNDEDQKRKKIRESEETFAKELRNQIEKKKKCIQKKVPENFETDIYGLVDKKFFSYANEVLEYARTRGMDDYPMKREIYKYCRANQLLPYPENLKINKNQLSEHRSKEIKLPKI